LVNEGYHVIIPNLRGYGNSSAPEKVDQYNLIHLTNDLIALINYFGYDESIFVGHDWGSTLVWGLCLLHPKRVTKSVNLSVPYLELGHKPWVEFLKDLMGSDHYMVHFNEYPGLADKVLDENTHRFLNNMFRKNQAPVTPKPGMFFINLAQEDKPNGDPIMSDDDLNVFVNSFKSTGFTPSINWYRNLDNNWHILSEVNPIIEHPVLMIYGDKDPVMQFDRLSDYVPNVTVKSLNCGHWIQEEEPEATNKLIIDWLKNNQ